MSVSYRIQAAFALLLLFGLPASRLAASPEVPGAPQRGPIALVGATIHPVSGPAVENGTLLFEEGRITAIGKKVRLPEKVQKIDLKGKHVYPGLIDSYSNMGLIEINAVRATRDSNETGRLNPNVKAQVAVNPDSELIPVTRSNGVLLSMTVPRGGLLSGTTALLQLDGWTYEDLTLKAPVAMHVVWPRMTPVTAWWMKDSKKDQLKQRDEALQQLRETFADARAYQRARTARGKAQPRDARLEALLPVLNGKLPLLASADDYAQIQSAVGFAIRQKMKLIIYGGYDAPLCAELLKKFDVPVIVGGIHRLPRRRSDDYDAAYTLPSRLKQAGVRYCISGSGRFGASNARNLPYHAATAAAYGLSPEEALKAITLYPAQILSAADRVGSLEVGKDATLIITDGNPLETATQVEAAYIQGRKVELNDRHKRLWRKYEEKYRQKPGK